MLLVVCVLLWVTNFVDQGYLETEDEAKQVYQNLLLVSVGFATISAPLVYLNIDRIHLGYQIAVFFALRASVLLFGYPNLTVPNSIGAYFVTSVTLMSSGIAMVLCETFFIKKCPGEIAGSMKGVFNFFGQLGTLCLTIVSGQLYDKVNPASPFIVVGCLDLCVCVLAIVMSLGGRMTVK